MVGLVLALTARPARTLPSVVASARRHSLLTSIAAGVEFVVTVGSLVWYVALRPTGGQVPPTPYWLGALPLIGAVAALTTRRRVGTIVQAAPVPAGPELMRQATELAAAAREAGLSDGAVIDLVRGALLG